MQGFFSASLFVNVVPTAVARFVAIYTALTPFMAPMFLRGPEAPPSWLRPPFMCPCAPSPLEQWWSLASLPTDDECTCVSLPPLGLLLLLFVSCILRDFVARVMMFIGVVRASRIKP